MFADQTNSLLSAGCKSTPGWRQGRNLVGIIIVRKAGVKGLKEDQKLHRTPADGEESNDDGHHTRDLGSQSFREFCQLLYQVMVIRWRHGGVSHLVKHSTIAAEDGQ
uniref:Uncharacterized protein n=1 Tax=Micrurus spixii TaxID=129469 RepID=A0A2D4M9P1_9SAUR